MTSRNSKKRFPENLLPASGQAGVLVHYHEIGLKGRNRNSFIQQLQTNIERRLAALWPETPARARRLSGRLWLAAPTLDQARQVGRELAEVPGVVRVSIAMRLLQDLALVQDAALELMLNGAPFASFKVAARRANTDFPIHSMELNQVVGGWLAERLPDKKVQMRQPDVTLHLEMIEGAALVFTESYAGVGGLPVGSGGMVVALLSAGIDSPVAAWRLLRRGAEVIALHFSGRPETASTSEYLVRLIADQLRPYGGLQQLVVVAFGSYQRQIAAAVPPALRIICYRRLMLVVAEALARRHAAKALVTGESLGQVASQTLDNILVVNAVVSLPVFRPLIGHDKLEIIATAQKLGTFAISSQSAEDCCTLFMPRNPATHARLDEVERLWAQLPIDEWTRQMMAELEYVDLNQKAAVQ